MFKFLISFLLLLGLISFGLFQAAHWVSPKQTSRIVNHSKDLGDALLEKAVETVFQVVDRLDNDLAWLESFGG